MDTPLLALTRPRRGGLPGRSPKDAAAENMRQLIQLRWLAVAGQLVAITVARFGLGVPLPVGAMLAVVGVLALANIVFTLTLRRLWIVRGELFGALLLDMAALTAQLYLSGGATNPFIYLYLLQVVLGAILLSPAMTWALIAVSCLCFAYLSVSHLPLLLPARLWDVSADLALVGEWLSYALVATLLVLFITRISRNLRARDAYVAELGQRAAEEDGIVRMGLFASGAAHELGTPLSSLAVLLADWRRHPALAADPAFREELDEAEAALGRCGEIVSNILHSAGGPRGEAMASEPARTLLQEIAEEWWDAHPGGPGRASLVTRLGGLGAARVAAEPALRQAVASLLENAGAAGATKIILEGRVEGDGLHIDVLDDGPGFPPEQLRDAGRLYQSSKGPGHGLGLFLASNVARRLGGTLRAANRDGGGAAVSLILPLASAGTPA